MLRFESNLTNAFSSLASSPNDQSPVTEFELNKDSSAWALGFRRIPVAQIGLHEDDLRRAVGRLAVVLERPLKRLPERQP